MSLDDTRMDRREFLNKSATVLAAGAAFSSTALSYGRIVGANDLTALDAGRFMVISGHLVPIVANPSISAYGGNTWFLRPCQTKHFCLSDSPFARRTNRILPLDSDVVSHVRPCISHGRNLMI